MQVAGPLTDAAENLVLELVTRDPMRLSHLTAVAARCSVLSVTVEAAHVDALVAAGWVHDIGYLPPLQQTGFHPLDGALYLRDTGWPDSVCDLVAHHSGSRFVARVHGLHEELDTFGFAEDPASDVLTIADNTSRPDGSLVTVTERLHEKLRRHGPDSPGAMANPDRDDYIRSAMARVSRWLAERGHVDRYLS